MNCFGDRFKAKNLLKTWGLLFFQKAEDGGINALNVMNREEWNGLKVIILGFRGLRMLAKKQKANAVPSVYKTEDTILKTPFIHSMRFLSLSYYRSFCNICYYDLLYRRTTNNLEGKHIKSSSLINI